MKSNKHCAMVFPPYIDAYLEARPGREITFETFVKWMKQHGSNWGLEAIKQMKDNNCDLAYQQYKMICCIGWWNSERYIAVAQIESDDKWWNNIEVIRYRWPDEWDVT